MVALRCSCNPCGVKGVVAATGGRVTGYRVLRPTIVDVAKRSGVSKSTVSNVLRGSERLSDATRQRVLNAIQELGYRPNAMAQALKRRRTYTIGLLTGDLRNPHYAELVGLVERHASDGGYATIIGDTGGLAECERLRLKALLEQRVRGIVLLHFSGEEAVINDANAADVPLVGLGVAGGSFDYVVMDDVEGGRVATEYLIRLGHRRIAYVPSPFSEASTNEDREQGWRKAMRAAGLDELEVIGVRPGDQSDRHITATMKAHSPTAFLAGNDATALRVIERIEEAGLSVPIDASVVGFDDIAVGRMRRLSLTTVRQPAAALAAVAMGHLLRRVEQEPDASGYSLREVFPAELVVRGSTAPPPG